MSGGEPGLARYLRPSADQRRLVAAMATGHARSKHARELGATTEAAFKTHVRAHLSAASTAVAVLDDKGRPRYLVADERTNRVAWITPHKEHRSTLFAPQEGVGVYIRAQRTAARPDAWRPLDLAATRAVARAAPRRIASAVRATDRTACTRVP